MRERVYREREREASFGRTNEVALWERYEEIAEKDIPQAIQGDYSKPPPLALLMGISAAEVKLGRDHQQMRGT